MTWVRYGPSTFQDVMAGYQGQIPWRSPPDLSSRSLPCRPCRYGHTRLWRCTRMGLHEHLFSRYCDSGGRPMETANIAVEAIWVFSRGAHAVSVWRFAYADGRRRIVIDGPAALTAVAEFPSIVECTQRQASLEGRLLTRGFHLRHFGVERRSRGDRRERSRGVDRRTRRAGNASRQVPRDRPQRSSDRQTHVSRRNTWYLGLRMVGFAVARLLKSRDSAPRANRPRELGTE